jgi:hypothetical protein
LIEAKDVDPVELAIAHSRLEDERGRIAAVEPLDVAEVLEDLGDRFEDRHDSVAIVVRLVDDRAAKGDVGREPRDDLRGIAGLDRFLKGLGADARTLAARSRQRLDCREGGREVGGAVERAVER